MRRITALLLVALMCACSKTEQAPSASGITGSKWHMEKYIDWITQNGVTLKDTSVIDPLAILAEFKSDGTVYVQERNGTTYINSNQQYQISKDTLFWIRQASPKVVDTFKVLESSPSKLSLFKAAKDRGNPSIFFQTWEYWVR